MVSNSEKIFRTGGVKVPMAIATMLFTEAHLV